MIIFFMENQYLTGILQSRYPGIQTPSRVLGVAFMGDITVRRGFFLGVIGAGSAGKSTLTDDERPE